MWKLTDRVIRTLICRDGCCGVSLLAVERWRGCGERGSTPRGGRTVLCVDSSSNQLVFSVGCNNETRSLPVLLFLANVPKFTFGWQPEMFAMTEYFGEFALARWGPLSKFFDTYSIFSFSKVFWVNWISLCVCVCVFVCILVFAVCLNNWSVHKVSYEPWPLVYSIYISIQ